MRRFILIALVVVMFAGLLGSPARAAACTNDNFADALEVAGLDHGDSCDSTAATTESPAGEPGPSCAAGKGFGKTLWWKYTPSVATQSHVKINTYDSSYNTLIALWEQTGSGFGGLVERACNDQLAIHKTSRVTQALTLGKTYYIQAGGVNNAGGTLNLRVKPRIWKVGVVRGDDWYFNNTFDAFAEYHIVYGASSDAKLVGGWGGHGVDTPWVRRGNLWIANDWFDSGFAKQFGFGKASDFPMLGDWNGDEIFTPAVRRNNTWYFNNGHDGLHDFSTLYGKSTDFPLVGDWNGDGIWTPGVRRGNVYYLNNGFDATHDIPAFAFGKSTDFPVFGDWDADGKMTPGLVRGNVWYLSNGFNGVQNVGTFAFGQASDRKVVGDWNGIVEIE
ncbi:MAG: hypothetical protein WEB06_19725 [Actinomycetota bacterium]